MGRIAVLGAMALVWAFAAPAFAGDIKKDDIVEILRGQGYYVQEFGPHSLGVQVDRFPIEIDIVGPDGDISYRVWLRDIDAGDVGHQFLNKFNHEIKFGRAYIDDMGDVIIQMDRNGGGGASIENVESDFDVFLSIIAKFHDDLFDQRIA